MWVYAVTEDGELQNYTVVVVVVISYYTHVCTVPHVIRFSFDCGIVDTSCRDSIPLSFANHQWNLGVPLLYQIIFWCCDRHVGYIVITPLYMLCQTKETWRPRTHGCSLVTSNSWNYTHFSALIIIILYCILHYCAIVIASIVINYHFLNVQ